MLVHILDQSLRVTVHLYFYILSFAEMTIELCSVFSYVLLKKGLSAQAKVCMSILLSEVLIVKCMSMCRI